MLAECLFEGLESYCKVLERAVDLTVADPFVNCPRIYLHSCNIVFNYLSLYDIFLISAIINI